MNIISLPYPYRTVTVPQAVIGRERRPNHQFLREETRNVGKEFETERLKIVCIILGRRYEVLDLILYQLRFADLDSTVIKKFIFLDWKEGSCLNIPINQSRKILSNIFVSGFF